MPKDWDSSIMKELLETQSASNLFQEQGTLSLGESLSWWLAYSQAVTCKSMLLCISASAPGLLARLPWIVRLMVLKRTLSGSQRLTGHGRHPWVLKSSVLRNVSQLWETQSIRSLRWRILNWQTLTLKSHLCFPVRQIQSGGIDLSRTSRRRQTWLVRRCVSKSTVRFLSTTCATRILCWIPSQSCASYSVSFSQLRALRALWLRSASKTTLQWVRRAQRLMNWRLTRRKIWVATPTCTLKSRSRRSNNLAKSSSTTLATPHTLTPTRRTPTRLSLSTVRTSTTLTNSRAFSRATWNKTSKCWTMPRRRHLTSLLSTKATLSIPTSRRLATQTSRWRSKRGSETASSKDADPIELTKFRTMIS